MNSRHGKQKKSIQILKTVVFLMFTLAAATVVYFFFISHGLERMEEFRS